jgi:hypothetical protein
LVRSDAEWGDAVTSEEKLSGLRRKRKVERDGASELPRHIEPTSGAAVRLQRLDHVII